MFVPKMPGRLPVASSMSIHHQDGAPDFGATLEENRRQCKNIYADISIVVNFSFLSNFVCEN